MAVVRDGETMPASSGSPSRSLDNPLPGSRMSMAYGQAVHPTRHTAYFHRGVDLVAPAGTPVHAAADGVVELATTAYAPAPDSGSVVVIDHGRGAKTFYAHLGTLLVRQGQQIRRGDTLALVGISGLTTGPHLHLEVWRDGEHVDPSSAVSGLPAAR